jgi:hypothetical protein
MAIGETDGDAGRFHAHDPAETFYFPAVCGRDAGHDNLLVDLELSAGLNVGPTGTRVHQNAFVKLPVG